jgi:hypothetical protein
MFECDGQPQVFRGSRPDVWAEVKGFATEWAKSNEDFGRFTMTRSPTIVDWGAEPVEREW